MTPSLLPVRPGLHSTDVGTFLSVSLSLSLSALTAKQNHVSSVHAKIQTLSNASKIQFRQQKTNTGALAQPISDNSAAQSTYRGADQNQWHPLISSCQRCSTGVFFENAPSTDQFFRSHPCVFFKAAALFFFSYVHFLWFCRERAFR